MYDFKCTHCDLIFDCFVPHGTLPACRECGGPTEKIWTSVNVITDTVPGGFIIENLNKTPTRFESKSEYKKALQARGATIRDRHVQTIDGSDKNPNCGRKWF